MNETNSEEETEILYQYNTDLSQMRLGNTVLMVLFLVIGVIGNAFVILIYFLKLKKSGDRYFIPFLAIFDLLSCLFGTSFSILTNVKQVTFQNDSLCKWLYFFVWFFSGASVFLLLVISIYRYRKVCKPLGRQMDTKMKRVSTVIVIIISGITSLPCFFLVKVAEKASSYKNLTILTYVCEYTSENDKGKVIYSLFSLFTVVCNLVLTVTLYVFIGRTIYKRFTRLKRTKKHGEHFKSTGADGYNVEMSKQKSDHVIETMGTSNLIISPADEPSSTNSPSANSRETVSATPTDKEAVRRNVRNNFTYMFMAIVVIYAISYIPMFLLITFPLKDRSMFWLNLRGIKLNVYLFFRRIYILNHIVNPFIYGYFDLTFREKVKECFLMIKQPISCCKRS